MKPTTQPETRDRSTASYLAEFQGADRTALELLERYGATANIRSAASQLLEDLTRRENGETSSTATLVEANLGSLEAAWTPSLLDLSQADVDLMRKFDQLAEELEAHRGEYGDDWERDMEEALDELAMRRLLAEQAVSGKLDGYAYLILETQAQLDFVQARLELIKAIYDAVSRQRNARQRKLARLKANVILFLHQRGLKRFDPEGATFKFWVQTNGGPPTLELLTQDPADVPEDCRRTIIDTKAVEERLHQIDEDIEAELASYNEVLKLEGVKGKRREELLREREAELRAKYAVGYARWRERGVHLRFK